MMRDPTEEEFLELMILGWPEETRKRVANWYGRNTFTVRIRDRAIGSFTTIIAGKAVFVCIDTTDANEYRPVNLIINEQNELALSNDNWELLKEGLNPILDHGRFRGME